MPNSERLNVSVSMRRNTSSTNEARSARLPLSWLRMRGGLSRLTGSVVTTGGRSGEVSPSFFLFPPSGSRATPLRRRGRCTSAAYPARRQRTQHLQERYERLQQANAALDAELSTAADARTAPEGGKYAADVQRPPADGVTPLPLVVLLRFSLNRRHLSLRCREGRPLLLRQGSVGVALLLSFNELAFLHTETLTVSLSLFSPMYDFCTRNEVLRVIIIYIYVLGMVCPLLVDKRHIALYPFSCVVCIVYVRVRHTRSSQSRAMYTSSKRLLPERVETGTRR